MRKTHNFQRNIPRSYGFEVLILRYNSYRIVALGPTRMLTIGSVIFQTANLLTSRTVALVAVVGIRVVTFRRDAAR